MAKTLLEFDGLIVDIMRVAKIEKRTEWSEAHEAYVYKIMFNRDLPDVSLIRDIDYEYLNMEYRDKKFEELKRKIGNIEHIVIL